MRRLELKEGPIDRAGELEGALGFVEAGNPMAGRLPGVIDDRIGAVQIVRGEAVETGEIFGAKGQRCLVQRKLRRD